jgi:hypothetical protein
MAITKVNSLGVSLTSPVTFPAGTVSLPSITTSGDLNTGAFFPAADTIGFTEGGAEAMRIDSSGRVGIGTTDVNGLLNVVQASNTQALLRLRNNTADTSTADGMIFTITDAAAPVGSIEMVSGGSDAVLAFRTNGAERMSITSTGSLILVGSTAQKASGTTWSNPSDTRLKDNKQNYTKGLTELLQINVKTWEWNGKAGTTEGTTGIGVVADEIEVLLPNTVDTYKAKLNIDDTEETDVKRFDATEITWLLLNSIKEQQAIIEQLKTRLTALESK